MDKEEKFIEERFGRKNPFRVPECYFDDFTSQLMKKLPEQTKSAQIVVMSPRRKSRWRNVVAVAACVVVGILSWSAYSLVSHSDQTAQQPVSEQVVDQSGYATMDAMADYTMMDNEDMYAYVSEY
jgi:hypothetical protein